MTLRNHIIQVHAVPEEEAKSLGKVVTKVGEEERLRPVLPKGKEIEVVPESSDDSSSHLKIASVQSMNPNQNLHNIPPYTHQLLKKQLQHHQQQQQRQQPQQKQQQMIQDNPGNSGGPIITSVRGGTVMPPPAQRMPVPSRDYSRVPGPMVSTPAVRPPPSVDALLRDHAHITSRLGIEGILDELKYHSQVARMLHAS